MRVVDSPQPATGDGALHSPSAATATHTQPLEHSVRRAVCSICRPRALLLQAHPGIVTSNRKVLPFFVTHFPEVLERCQKGGSCKPEQVRRPPLRADLCAPPQLQQQQQQQQQQRQQRQQRQQQMERDDTLIILKGSYRLMVQWRPVDLTPPPRPPPRPAGAGGVLGGFRAPRYPHRRCMAIYMPVEWCVAAVSCRHAVLPLTVSHHVRP